MGLIMKVTIKIISELTKWEDRDSIEVLVDNELIGTGNYGGEPEDNSRTRDYSWIETLIEKLAKKLGAEVVCENIEIEGLD